MRLLVIFAAGFLFFSCGSNSSPEGRITNKLEEIRLEFDSLKKQNNLILDSLGKISEEVRNLRNKN
jgi:hypothetical protein